MAVRHYRFAVTSGGVTRHENSPREKSVILNPDPVDPLFLFLIFFFLFLATVSFLFSVRHRCNPFTSRSFNRGSSLFGRVINPCPLPRIVLQRSTGRLFSGCGHVGRDRQNSANLAIHAWSAFYTTPSHGVLISRSRWDHYRLSSNVRHVFAKIFNVIQTEPEILHSFVRSR